jgi:Amidohydrolase
LELARHHPDIPFILDHIGKSDIRRGLMEPWRSQFRAMAALPNVTAKLSGAITEAHPERRTVDHIRPNVLEMADATEANLRKLHRESAERFFVSEAAAPGLTGQFADAAVSAGHCKHRRFPRIADFAC